MTPANKKRLSRPRIWNSASLLRLRSDCPPTADADHSDLDDSGDPATKPAASEERQIF
jgi:hypothetical protein